MSSMVPAEAAVPASSDNAITAAPQIFESNFMVWFSFVPRNLFDVRLPAPELELGGLTGRKSAYPRIDREQC
ncbi:hypothetical protein D3C87_2138310 [compost metagenome]